MEGRTIEVQQQSWIKSFRHQHHRETLLWLGRIGLSTTTTIFSRHNASWQGNVTILSTRDVGRFQALLGSVKITQGKDYSLE